MSSPACPLCLDKSREGVIFLMMLIASASKAFIFTPQLWSGLPPKDLIKNLCLLKTAENTNAPLLVAFKWVIPVLIPCPITINQQACALFCQATTNLSKC